MLENLFVLSVLLLSGGYVLRRMHRMQQAFKRRESACGSCASAGCGSPASTTEPLETGETVLPLR